MKTLQLTNPYQRGRAVERVQRLLVRAGYRIRVDGEAGPATFEAVEDAKRRLGYRKKGWAIRPTAGDRFVAALEGAELPLVRSSKRKATLREKIVAYCRWSIEHEPQIHYAQERPMDLANLYGLPQRDDCSEHATKAYKSAGAPDPNGRRYDGYGYTGTLISRGRRVALEHARPGDLVLYGAGTGRHVAVLLEPGHANGGDPMLCSHGQERGPIAIRYSEEDRFQAGPTQVRNYLGD